MMQRWQQLEQKFERTLSAQNEILKQVMIRPARWRIRLMAIWPIMDLVLSLFMTVVCGGLLREHWRDVRLLIPAIVLIAGSVLLFADGIRRLRLVAAVDWSGPVASIQTSLERLRAAKLRHFKWVMLLAPLIGFCQLMVVLFWLADFVPGELATFLEKLDSKWVVANYVFGALFVPLGYFAAGILAKKCYHQAWLRSMLDGMAGNQLRAAAQDVARWASLQQ